MSACAFSLILRRAQPLRFPLRPQLHLPGFSRPAVFLLRLLSLAVHSSTPTLRRFPKQFQFDSRHPHLLINVYICIYMCVYIHMYIYRCLNIQYIYLKYAYTHIHSYMHRHLYVYISMYRCIYIYIFVLSSSLPFKLVGPEDLLAARVISTARGSAHVRLPRGTKKYFQNTSANIKDRLLPECVCQAFQAFASNHFKITVLNISLCFKTESDSKLSLCLSLFLNLQEV